MEEEIQAIQERIKRVREEGEKEIAQLRKKNTCFPLLDDDLAVWKKKLQQTVTKDTTQAWRLYVYTEPDGLDNALFCPTLDSEDPWLAETWVKSGNRRVGINEFRCICYGSSLEDLMPPPLQAMRLALFGITWAIHPVSYYGWSSKESLKDDPEGRLFAYGLYRYLDPSAPMKSQFTDAEYIKKVYVEYQNSSQIIESMELAEKVTAKLQLTVKQSAGIHDNAVKRLDNWKRALELKRNIPE